MAPVFNSRRASSEWQKLVEDLIGSASAGNNQSTSIGSLKERFGKLEVAINVAPSRLINSQLRDMAKGLDKKFKNLETNGGDEKTRKEMRDELRKLERSLIKNALSSQTTMGMALVRNAEKKQRENERNFMKTAKEQARELRQVLAKQLLEVNETRSLSDSDGLRRLEKDLADALRALKVEDFKRFKSLSDSIKDLKGNYGVSDDTSDKLSSIEDLVKEDLERKDARSDRLNRNLERTADFFKVGGVYRGVRRTARAVGATYRAGRSVKNAVSRGVSRAAAYAYKARSPLQKKSPSSAIGAAGLLGSPANEREASRDREDSSLLRRQVRALEVLGSASKKLRGAGQAIGSGVGGLASSVLGPLLKMGKLGAKFLGPLLARLGPLALAAFGGWKLGSFIYEKFSEEIQTGIEAIVGVVTKGIEFASKGYEWFKSFLSNPLDRIKEIGGTLKAAWDNSVFARFFSSPGKIMQEGVSSLLGIVSNAMGSAGSVVSDLSNKALSQAGSVAGTLRENGSAALNAAGGMLSSAASVAKDTVVSGYRSITDAVGKLFKSKPNVDLENLHPVVKDNFLKMTSEYKALGGTTPISVNAGYRSYEEQARQHAMNPRLAAPPGRSSHEKGLAIDIDSAGANKLDSMGLLAKYGFSRPVAGEAWHLQAKGTASALAAQGIYSADDAGRQGQSSRIGGSAATPAVESIPPVSNTVSSGATSSGSASSQGPRPMMGPITQGSASNVPTFSYMDSGFFLMNAGVIAG